MLCSAFGTVSAQLIEHQPDPATDPAVTVIKIDNKGDQANTNGKNTVKFASGSNYYVVMTGADGAINSGDLALGIKNTDGALSSTSKNVDNIVVTDSEEYLWKVEKVTGTDGKTYYTFYNAKAKAYLTFTTGGALVEDADKAVLGKEGQSAYFSFDGAEYAGNGKALKLAANSSYLNITASAINSSGSSSSGIVLYKAAEITKKATELNKMYTGGKGGASFKFATEPDENIFAQKLLAVDLDGATGWKKNYPKGTYFAVYYPENGISSKEDFLASTFISLDLDTTYDLNGLDNAAGQGYGFKVVAGTDIMKSPDIEKGELPAANAAFTVTVKDPSNAPTKFDISLTATVIKDGKYVAGKAVNVYVASNAGAKILTTGGTATKAELGMSNIIKPEALLKEDAPAVYKIMFTSGSDATDSEYGKFLHSTSTNNTAWSLLAEGADFVGENSPAIQWTISKVEDDGQFTFRNRESGQTLKLGLYDIDGDVTIDKSSVRTMTYGYLTRNNEYRTGTASLSGATIQLIPVETIDPMAGFLNMSDEEIAYGPVKINFAAYDNRTANDLYLSLNNSTYQIEAQKEEFGPIMWEVVKHDLSAAAKKAAKSDTIQVVNGYAYWDAAKKAVKASAAGDTIAVLAYSFKLNEQDAYLDQTATGYTSSDYMGRFVFKENVDGSYSMLKADTYAKMIKPSAKVATVDPNGLVAFTGSNADYLYTATPKSYRDVYLVRDAMESLESVSRHAALQAVNGGFVGISATNDAIVAAKSEAGTDLTFWLDTADVDTYYPSFFISRGIAAETKAAETDRLFLFNPKDSALYYNTGVASAIRNKAYHIDNNVNNPVKAMFRPATLVNQDTLTTTINGKEATIAAVANAKEGVLGGLNNYKFNIVKVDEDEYAIRSVSNGLYLYNLNGKLGFGGLRQAMVITLAEGDATANEAIAAEGVQVIGGQGVVTVQGAAGKVITVANILGQTIANQVAASDNVTIAVPAGIVVVAVDGEATKVVVK